MRQELKHLTMKQLLDIKENQYRSKDCTVDYCPFSVEERIIELKIKKATVELDLLPVEPKVEFDHQLAGLLSVEMPEKHLLALIDAAMKMAKLSPVQDAEITQCGKIKIAWNGNEYNHELFGYYGLDHFGNEVYFPKNDENESYLESIFEETFDQEYNEDLQKLIKNERYFKSWKDC